MAVSGLVLSMNLLVPPSFYTAADLEYTMSYRDVVQQGSTYTHTNTSDFREKNKRICVLGKSREHGGFKIEDFYSSHIHNYTEYNQQ